MVRRVLCFLLESTNDSYASVARYHRAAPMAATYGECDSDERSVPKSGRAPRGDVLADSPLWDSLTVLSLIAKLGSTYGVSLTAADLRETRTAGDLEAMVLSKKRA